MQISFESPEKVGGVLTLTVEEGDYKADVEKKLKEYRRRANMPGFRPGQVPMGLIRRQMGNSVKVDIINELLGKEMQKYITDNKLAVLGQPPTRATSRSIWRRTLPTCSASTSPSSLSSNSS